MLKSLLNGSRFLVLAAVLGALAGAAALFISVKSSSSVAGKTHNGAAAEGICDMSTLP